jgi:acyl-CoA-dependent ceramide synthase
MLASLQALNLFWLYCLLRSAYRFVVHNIAKDDRSESDSEPEELEPAGETKKVEAPKLLGSNGATNGSAHSVLTASGNSIASTATKRKGSHARDR